jgi:hypothetical protein
MLFLEVRCHRSERERDPERNDNEAYSTAEIHAGGAKLGFWANSTSDTAMELAPGQAVMASQPSVTTAGGCGTVLTCTQLSSCDAVKRYVRHCDSMGLDGDRDGLSYESLCR